MTRRGHKGFAATGHPSPGFGSFQAENLGRLSTVYVWQDMMRAVMSVRSNQEGCLEQSQQIFHQIDCVETRVLLFQIFVRKNAQLHIVRSML